MSLFAKILLAVVGFSLLALLWGCKTMKPTIVTNTTTSTSESKALKTSSSDSIQELINNKPATRNKVEFEPTINDSGDFGKTKLQSITGDDTLTVRTEGKKVIVESNCAAQVSYWKKEVHRRDSLIEKLQSRDSSHIQVKEVPVPYKVEVEVPKTPWYIWMLIGGMSLTIVGLLISKFF